MSIDQLRQRASLAIGAGATAFTFAVVLADVFVRGGVGTASIIAFSGLIGLVVSYAAFRSGPAFRYMAVSVLMTQVAAMLIALHGKGFAVVAVEVRRLAQSAATASADVKRLIEESGSEVATGSGLVEAAAEQLRSMLSSARNSDDLVTSIAAESHSQATSIEHVNSAVQTVDGMTQRNAALVEEMNATVERTEDEAARLDELVARFKLDGERDLAEPRQVAAPKRLRAAGGRSAQNWSEF